jgi:imidazoleglycerol-phosphate dehydratase / histidinol-phosphatase
MKKVLFIDRDGTLIWEPPITEQVDNIDQLEFLPHVIRNLYYIRRNLDYELVIVSNQDGLGTESYPEERFNSVQHKMLTIFKNEDISFDEILIDKHFPKDNAPTRKPGTGMLSKYMSGDYDLASSFVIGDRLTDIQLAKNLGAKGILVGGRITPKELDQKGLSANCSLIASSWDEVYKYLISNERAAEVLRKTKETDITVRLSLDGQGHSDILTGVGFFNHMLDQIAKHAGINLYVRVKGDLDVDEHHTVEDTALALGEAFLKALGDKKGIERYGYALPMDDSWAQVLIDFGGRNWLVWDTAFRREKIGEMPTEMFFHFFKSFSDAAKCNLNIKADGENEHHKIEAIFKSFARALKMAINKDIYSENLPSTKGTL